MNLKKIGKLLASNGLGIIGRVIGGNAGGEVASMISEKLGLSSESDFENAVNDPKKLAELKKFEAENETKLFELMIQDRDSARHREIEITKATGSKDYFLYSIAGGILLGFFLIVGFVVITGTELNNTSAMLVQCLVNVTIAVVSYFFGSSKGSADKTHLLRK